MSKFCACSINLHYIHMLSLRFIQLYMSLVHKVWCALLVRYPATEITTIIIIILFTGGGVGGGG